MIDHKTVQAIKVLPVPKDFPDGITAERVQMAHKIELFARLLLVKQNYIASGDAEHIYDNVIRDYYSGLSDEEISRELDAAIKYIDNPEVAEQ